VLNPAIALLGAKNAVSEKTEFAVATGMVHLVGMGKKTSDVKNRVFRPWEHGASVNQRKAPVLGGRGRWEKAAHRKVVDIGQLWAMKKKILEIGRRGGRHGYLVPGRSSEKTVVVFATGAFVLVRICEKKSS
jgi:hypothetical protein